MCLSNGAKSFLASVLLITGFAGCRFWQDGSNTAAPLTIRAKNEIPFATREPDVFQAELVIKANGVERRIFIAKNGEKRRIDYDFATPNQRTVLTADKKYLISFAGKIFAEISPGTGSTGGANDDLGLTANLLYQRGYASFEEIGTENNMTRYRVRLDGSDSSEAEIVIDQTIGLPVKQEFYSIESEKRILLYSTEIQNLKPEADDALFKLPVGFRKITPEEFYHLDRPRK